MMKGFRSSYTIHVMRPTGPSTTTKLNLNTLTDREVTVVGHSRQAANIIAKDIGKPHAIQVAADQKNQVSNVTARALVVGEGVDPRQWHRLLVNSAPLTHEHYTKR